MAVIPDSARTPEPGDPPQSAFRLALDHAAGHSEFVIALNIDVRGFSDWSLTVDSAQTGLFVTRIYARLIDDYFTTADFVKPTGDGLLVVLPFSRDTVREAVNATVRDAFQILEGFPSFCKGDDMINFDVPEKVGIGLARGPASRLATESATLDYSGNTLNLASRLMDLARPSGVVLDGRFGFELLDEGLQAQFSADEVYLKGIAPNKPLPIYASSDVEIPDIHKRPLGEPEWGTATEDFTGRNIRDYGPRYRLYLPSRAKPATIKVTAHYPAVRAGKRIEGINTSSAMTDFRYEQEPDKQYIVLNFGELYKKIRAAKVLLDWPVQISVRYHRL